LTPDTDGSLALASAAAPQPERPQLVLAHPEPGRNPNTDSTPDLAAIRSAAVAALESSKGQQSAADALSEASFRLQGDTLEIAATVSKAMLPVIFNAEAERTIKSALRDAGAGNLRLRFSPGAPAANGAKQKRAPRAGSAAELAENHPVVQQAKRLFSAELSNVIDLRDKS
jgi:DNA polymerase-3 subunit gamma/tau